MNKYNRNKIEEQLSKQYPGHMYNFVRCILGLVDDMNSGKIDLDTPVGEFLGFTVEDIFKTNNIQPEPAAKSPVITHIPHQQIKKIQAKQIDNTSYMLVTTMNPHNGETSEWLTLEITVDDLSIYGKFSKA